MKFSALPTDSFTGRQQMLAEDQKLFCSRCRRIKFIVKKLNKIFKNYNFLIYLRKLLQHRAPVRSGFTVLTLVP